MLKLIKKYALLLIVLLPLMSLAETDLADKPLLAGSSVPGNVALTISAEFPTALTYAYTASYTQSVEYIGYFDANKCYIYSTANHYFTPSGAASSHKCSGKWSGNFLNWATMQSLDPFRQTLTGGNRVVDTSSVTVLEKAWSSGQGGYKNRSKSISGGTLISQSTPFSGWSNFYIRIDMLGNKMWYSGTTSPNVTTADTLAEVAGTSVIADTVADSSSAATNKIYEKYTRVMVCDSSAGVEANCFKYPNGNFKPIGLIQKNAMKLRFAAFGYLADPTYATDNGYTGTYSAAGQTRNQALQGGVLRAKMASLGPLKPNPGGLDLDNSAASEWDANTGVFKINPDSTSASTTATNNGLAVSAVPNSGVINYLNKFGSTAGKYKVFDRTAELYYAAIRYFKNLENVPEYTDMAGYSTAEKQVLIDGFPVIKTSGSDSDDPVKYSCQANFIIGIGDNNTYNTSGGNGNLPGSLSFSGTLPAKVVADTSVDVSVATNRVGALQGLGNIGNGNTRLMAGLAFDSHTRDIRPADADMPGVQTVSTYWLDVLESGYVANNQYVLATKFGGFDVPSGYNSCSTSATCATPPTIPSTTTGDLTWDKNGDGKPDNYFEANNPAAMTAGLEKAFADILSKLSGSSNTLAVPSPSIQSGSMSFATSYSADTWSGNVIGNTVTFSNGAPLETVAWNASDKLNTQAAGTGWSTGRYIATSVCSNGASGTKNCTGTPFRPGNLTSLMSNFAFNTSTSNATDQTNIINFIRGDASNTGALGAANLRKRAHILGDIVNSKVVAIGPPRSTYSDTFNPGYSNFMEVNKTRPTVAYVGANDGMLHAFNGAANGGNELFAYIPNALIKGPTNTPSDNGLAALANPSYNHRYFVNSTPYVKDVNFGGGDNDWHTILIGGLGKGGKSYYALDVTNPSAMSNEANLSTKVLWEFSHEDLGYTYGRPLVVKTKKYGWTVIFGSGYNNTDGKGYFFLVNPKTGELLEKIATGSGSTLNDAGLAHVSAFVADQRSFETDAAYAGDLLGNVWRLDLSTAGPTPAPIKIAAFGASQPITVSPVIEVETSTLKRYVFVGTGRILADSDANNTQEQALYAILDGTQSKPFTSSTLPSGVSYPIGPSVMVDNTNSLTSGGATATASQPMGYYIKLGNSGGAPYRFNIDMASSTGVLVFVVNSLNANDPCSPTGDNKTYAISYGTGRSVLLNINNTVVPNIVGKGLATSVSFFREYGTKDVRINISNDVGESSNTKIDTSGAMGFQQLNWRELPTSD